MMTSISWNLVGFRKRNPSLESSLFISFYFFSMCVMLCITGFIYVTVVPVEARKGCWVLQN